MTLTTVSMPMDRAAEPDALAGRNILVTGAAGGLGRATALACARAGAHVILSGRKVRPLEKVYDEIIGLDRAEPSLLPLDLAGASPADYDTVVKALRSAGDCLHGLVHAAAHFENLAPISMKSPDTWLLDMQVNLTAPFLLTQACMPLLQAAEDSAVVFVLDDRQRLARAHWNGYGVAKAGLERLAEILHEETDQTPLRVHSLLPDPMRTVLRRKAWFGENTMQLPVPDEAASAVVWLLGPQAQSARGKLLSLRSQPEGAVANKDG